MIEITIVAVVALVLYLIVIDKPKTRRDGPKKNNMISITRFYDITEKNKKKQEFANKCHLTRSQYHQMIL